MKRSEDNRAEQISGTIQLPDGLTVGFSVSANGLWQQWGAPADQLARTAPIVELMADELFGAALIVSDADDDYEPETEPRA